MQPSRRPERSSQSALKAITHSPTHAADLSFPRWVFAALREWTLVLLASRRCSEQPRAPTSFCRLGHEVRDQQGQSPLVEAKSAWGACGMLVRKEDLVYGKNAGY